MFADEARFGRMNRARPCWAPNGTRPQVACQLIREDVYLYGAVSPKDGTCVYLIPCARYRMLPGFPGDIGQEVLQAAHPAVRGWRREELEVPPNIILHLLPRYSPELSPQENLWDEIREKIFKNYALKSMDEVYAKLEDAAHRTQSGTRQIHHVVPLHHKVTLIWKRILGQCAAFFIFAKHSGL
jgi:hypothetical protein